MKAMDQFNKELRSSLFLLGEGIQQDFRVADHTVNVATVYHSLE